MGDNVFANQSLGFHGINFDFIKLESILMHGLLTKEESLKRGVKICPSYEGFDTYNFVSLSESPSISNTFNRGAFNVHIKDSISLVVDLSDVSVKKNYDKLNSSGIVGEVLSGSVSTDKIVGIMLPSNMVSTPISKIKIFGSVGLKISNSYGLDFIDMMNDLYNSNVSNKDIKKLMDLNKKVGAKDFAKLEWEMEINSKINDLISMYFVDEFKKMYGCDDNVTLLEAVSLISKDKYDIYDSLGNLLKAKNNVNKK